MQTKNQSWELLSGYIVDDILISSYTESCALGSAVVGIQGNDAYTHCFPASTYKLQNPSVVAANFLPK